MKIRVTFMVSLHGGVHIFLFVILFLFITADSTSLYAAEEPIKSKSALPGEPCQTKPLKSWTSQEKWVWKQVCEGKIADFNRAEGYGGNFDPREPEGWPENRILQPSFLKTILLYEPYLSALTHNGVCIIGAWFKESLDLSNATLAHEVCLDNSRFESEVDLSRLKSSHLISLMRSKFNGQLNMDFLQVEGYLYMRQGDFAEVALGSAKIGGLAMEGSKFNGQLFMDALQVNGHLLMRQGEFAEVVLRGAKVGGQLDMDGEGSKFNGQLIMENLQVGSSLLMRQGEFAEVVLLRGATVGGQLVMEGSKFNGQLNMNSLQVNSSLLMHQGKFAEVNLGGATVGGQLAMIESKFNGQLNMNSLQVNSSLLMDKGKFAEVNFRSATVGGHLTMIESKFNGQLIADALQVNSYLLMRQGKFAEVTLLGTTVGGQLDMDESKFNRQLIMENLQVGSSLFMRGATVKTELAPARLIFAKIGTNLDISSSTLSYLDLTGTQVRGEFRLANTVWEKNAKLILRGTKVGALQDLPKAWPDNLELEGFAYDRLSGFKEDSTHEMAARDVFRYKEWLEKQESHSPQPYEQLASVLQKTGHKEKADDILYYGKERERSKATGLNRLWLTLLWIFIGYGYRIWYAFVWVLLFVTIGAFIFRRTEEAKGNKMPYGIAYSFDMLLPIIKLRERHYDIDLSGWPRYYFYFHKIMGYVLASFLIAGLSGLTK